MISQKILVLDFGGQSTHLISRRLNDAGFYSEIVPSSIDLSKIKSDKSVKGIILSGGARSVYEKNRPVFDKKILFLKLPILGICYGHQLIAHLLGGKVIQGSKGEYGETDFKILQNCSLLKNAEKESIVWMNHKDIVTKLSNGFVVFGSTRTTPIAAYGYEKKKIFGVQFHPEVSHTKNGNKILLNFANLTGIKPEKTVVKISDLVKDAKDFIRGRAVVGLSGGVDSAVAALIVAKAISSDLLSVYVDTGLMRSGETEQIKKTFSNINMRLKVVDARKIFFKSLKGVIDPELKREIIGKLFIEIFNSVAKKFRAEYLVQGTIYSDRIESGTTKNSAKIKSHHNVGGLPSNMKLKVYEPLRNMYKDEVRLLAKKLGLPDEIVDRKAFPGPGLAIRILGEVAPEKVEIIRKADSIITEELKKSDIFKKIYMALPVLLSIKSVGIQGDDRTYKYALALRVIESDDVITANFSRIPYDILNKISTRITNEIKEINRVVYDITNKPPATMEWE